MAPSETNSRTETYRAAPSAWIAMAAPPWLFFLVIAGMVISRPSAGGDGSAMAGLMALLALLASAWIGLFKLEIGRDFIRYRSLLTRERTLRLDAIERADFVTGYPKGADRSLPPFRLEIVEAGEPRPRRTVVNIRMLSRQGVVRLSKALERFKA